MLLNFMSSFDAIYAFVVIVVAYFVRGISGFGSSLLAVPLLSLRFPLSEVVPFMLVNDVVASAIMSGLALNQMKWREILHALPATFIGLIVGTYMLVSLPAILLLSLLGLFVLVFAARTFFVYNENSNNISCKWVYPAAFSGGTVSGLFGTGGPLYVIYLSHRIRDKSVLRATFSGMFFMEGMLRIITFSIAGLFSDITVWRYIGFALPFVILALYLGSHIHVRLTNRQMRQAIGVLLLVSGVSLLIKAWL